MKPKRTRHKKRKTGMAYLCVPKAVHARIKALVKERGNPNMPFVTAELLTAALDRLDAGGDWLEKREGER
jgi:hypothetical protein